MLVRILTALVGIPLFVGLLYVGRWPLFALVAGMGLIGFHEYARMWRAKGVQVAFPLGSLFVLLMLSWAMAAPDNTLYLGALLTAAPMAMLTWLLADFARRTVVDALISLAGIIYVGWLLSHILLLRGLGEGMGWDLGFRWIMVALLCTWVADTAAYFAGRLFGRHKLLPAVSPNKTVEGAVGGGVGTVAAGSLLAPVVAIAPWQGAAVGLAIFFLAVTGDLAESALKRHTGVKDSGSLLPGHGGILDRFDSSLFVVPFVYYVARLFFVT